MQNSNKLENKTYVFDGVEVRKTGRVATRVVDLPNKKQATFELVEITPTDTTGFQWLKWVKNNELYLIAT